MLVVTVVWTLLISSSIAPKTDAFTVMHRSPSDQIDDRSIEEVDDLSPYDYLDTLAKREKKGTCTCTCETKPAVIAAPQIQKVVEPRPPESASLLRTATGPAASVKSSGYNSKSASLGSSNSKEATSTGKSHTGRINNAVAPNSKGKGESDSTKIVKVAPVDDFELMPNDQPYVPAEQSYDEAEHKTQNKAAHGNKHQETWGHGSRYPWKSLPDMICFREPCHSDKDCCLRYNICDRSAKVCVDCWYGSTCSTERDCCLKYPYCHRTTRTSQEDGSQVAEGKCVNSL